MRTWRASRALLTVVVAIASLAGCVRGERPVETVSRAPEAASQEESAKAAVDRYVRVLGDVMRSHDAPMASLETVAIGELLKADLHVYGGTRAFGTFERGGRAQVLDPVVVPTPSGSPSPSAAGGRPYVLVDACRDTTHVRAFNTHGKQPVVPFPAKPGRYKQRFTVVLTADGWRVASRENLAEPGIC